MNRGNSAIIEQPWPIPPHWRWSKMGEIAAVIGGGTPPTGRADYFGGEVPWITPADLSKYTEKTISRGTRNITQAGLENSGARLLPAGTVLFSSRAPIGYVAIAANPVATNQGFKSFILNDEVRPDFVYYYLQRARDLARSLASGTTFLEISGKKAAQIPVPVAPLDEQERIVAEIEKQFSRLDAGVASLKRVQTALKRYRASVLKDACEGQLVRTEAELARKETRSYETGEQLLQRILKERREKWNGKGKYKEPVAPKQPSTVDLPEGWEATFIEPLLSSDRVGIKTGPFGSLLKKYEHRANGVPVLGIENISNMRFVPGNKIYIEKTKADQLAGYDAREGDVLISRSGTVGEVCVIPKGIGAARISSNVMRVSLLSTGLLPEFFSILFNGSPTVLRQISQLCSGSTRDFLNQEILRSIIFPLPPLAEQRRIVAEVERRMSVIEELEAATLKQLQRAVRLRQAILRAAFSATLA